jgi:hypothetical protein
VKLIPGGAILLVFQYASKLVQIFLYFSALWNYLQAVQVYLRLRII